MVDVFCNANFVGTELGTESNPFSQIQPAWDDIGTFLGGTTYNFFLAGTVSLGALSAVSFGGGGSGAVTINLLPWPGQTAGRYLGTQNLDTAFAHIDEDVTTNNAALIEFDPDQVVNPVVLNIEALQFRKRNTAASSTFLLNLGAGNADIEANVRACRLINDDTGGGSFPRVIRLRPGLRALNLENTILVGAESQINCSSAFHNDRTSILAVNCAFLDCVEGSTPNWLEPGNGFDAEVVNSLIYNSGTAAASGNGTLTLRRNAAENASDRGTGGVDIDDPTRDGNVVTPGGAPTGDQRSEENVANAGDYSDIGEVGGSVPLKDIRDFDRNAAGSTSGGPFAATGEGSSGHTATISLGAPAATSSASATQTFAGSADQAAPAAEQSAAASLAFDGSAAQSAPASQQALSADLEFAGQIGQDAPAATQSAQGVQGTSGQADQTGPAATQSLVGQLSFAGQIAQIGPAATQQLTGATVVTITATVAQTGPSPEQVMAASEIFAGQADQVTAMAVQSLTAFSGITGVIVLAAPAAFQSLSGNVSASTVPATLVCGSVRVRAAIDGTPIAKPALSGVARSSAAVASIAGSRAAVTGVPASGAAVTGVVTIEEF